MGWHCRDTVTISFSDERFIIVKSTTKRNLLGKRFLLRSLNVRYDPIDPQMYVNLSG